MRSLKTGLLAATTGAFIIEFYKKLSADSGDRTAYLLGQISKQLADPRNGAAADQPFSPGAPVIWINAMWLISLVFSITSALVTSLNKQAVRRFFEGYKGQVIGKPNGDARLRMVLFRRATLYKIPHGTWAARTLLHLSILLFFGGLVIAFHTIYHQVAIAVDVAVGVSGLLYMTMSLLPLLDPENPYYTPITYILEYLCDAFFSFAKRLPGCPCLSPCPSTFLARKQDTYPDSSDSFGKVVEERSRYFPGGFRESVINDATNPAEDEDRETITWLFRRLSALRDKNKLLVFAASIPRDKVTKFIRPIKSGKFVLKQPFLVLLQSCTGARSAGDPSEDVRRSALRVCLTAIDFAAKASPIPDLNFVRDKLANIRLMQPLWNDSESFIRITSSSICALVARQVVRKTRIKGADLRWLVEVIRKPSNEILEADVTIRDEMNLKSFVSRALPNTVNHLSTEDDTS